MPDISDIHPTIYETRESYRQAAEYMNMLMVENYRKIALFKIEQRVALFRRHGIERSKVAKWKARNKANIPRKTEEYRQRLAARLDDQVENYVRNLRSTFGY